MTPKSDLMFTPVRARVMVRNRKSRVGVRASVRVRVRATVRVRVRVRAMGL